MPDSEEYVVAVRVLAADAVAGLCLICGRWLWFLEVADSARASRCMQAVDGRVSFVSVALGRTALTMLLSFASCAL